ncbi:nickel pincer cofactor biosynthesis protein LarC [Candidatus Margulisiibacteriota bacterium]
MKIAYFDCPSGISGNMILGALIHAGMPLSHLKKELKKIKIDGYQLSIKEVKKLVFKGTYFNVQASKQTKARSFNDILRIIRTSGLSKAIKDKSLAIFKKLAEAEAKAHGETLNKVHLHDVSGTDAIIDIVGAVIGLEYFNIKDVYCSALPFGKGRIKHRHGYLPNPSPATTILLKGVPTYKTDIKGELVTPTGAAIIREITKQFDALPKLEMETMGLGAGFHDFKIANVARLFIGESEAAYEKDLIYSIETNIDNLNPELYDYIIGKLMKAGALDAYIGSIQMKKKRPGIILSVLSKLEDKEKLLNIIFSETSTLGVRTYLVRREKLERHNIKVKTKYGSIYVKVGKANGKIKNIAPEYEACKKLAKQKNVPLKSVFDEARSNALRSINL